MTSNDDGVTGAADQGDDHLTVDPNRLSPSAGPARLAVEVYFIRRRLLAKKNRTRLDCRGLALSVRGCVQAGDKIALDCETGMGSPA